MSLVRRADISERKRRQLARDTFFAALEDDMELQHWVAQRDDADEPNVHHTLSLATYYERMHGRRNLKRDRGGRANYISDSDTLLSTPRTDVTEDEDVVNKIGSLRINDMHSEDGRKLARAHNELAYVLKRQAKVALDDRDNSDYRRSDSRSHSSRSGSTYTNRSSSSYSSRRRSRSRGRKYEPKPRDDRYKGGNPRDSGGQKN
jgi:hypothetical protein